MKKKVYYIASSILQMCIAIYSIIVSASISDKMVAAYKEQFASIFSEDMIESIVSKIHGEIIVFLSIIILFGLLTLIYALTNKINYKKVPLIVFSIVTILLGGEINVIFALLGIATLVVSSTIVREKKEKKPVKFIKEVKRDKKSIIKGIVLFVSYLFIMFVLPRIVKSFVTIPEGYLGYINFATDIFLLILAVLLYLPELKEHFKVLKENVGGNFKTSIKTYLISLPIYFVVGIIATIVSGGASVNQQSLETLPLWYILFGAVIYAPIVEELVFRGSIRKLFKNNIVFIIISAILFGLIHVTSEETILMALLRSLPYMVLGATLAISYTKTNNLYSSMMIHFVHNSFAALMIILSAL